MNGATQAESYALEIQNLTKVYPDGTVAVDDISFTVADGDYCVVIGPSGCGKSTTLHSIVGKVAPTEGQIVIGGNDVTTEPTHERDIGLVFQDFQLFPHMNVDENVRYGLERVGRTGPDAEDMVADTLTLMDLDGITDRYPGELSAGQKQRVALARSLVLRPEVLLLDEPLGDLDYKLKKRMEQELLRVHHQLDTTFVHVTHDQRQAMRLADQLIVLNDGKIEQSGPIAEIYDEPDTAFVATFVGDSNIFTGQVREVSGEDATVETAYGSFRASTENVASDPSSLVDEEVQFSVRPKRLRLSDGEVNAIDCTVLDVLHRPSKGTQIVLEIADADKQLQLLSPEKLDVDRETVTVGWDPTDATLLERTSVVPGIDLEKDILGE